MAGKRYYHKPEEALEFIRHRQKFAGEPADDHTVKAIHVQMTYTRYLIAKYRGLDADRAEAAGDHAEAARLRESADRLRFDPNQKK